MDTLDAIYQRRAVKNYDPEHELTPEEDVWNSKLKPTEGVNASKGIPNISDLIKIAKEDQDPTFRIWASLRLGYALYERGDQGNQKAITAAIEELKLDSNKQVAAAAKAGESIKDSDEYYELRK